jgi:hypothetical protein
MKMRSGCSRGHGLVLVLVVVSEAAAAEEVTIRDQAAGKKQ